MSSSLIRNITDLLEAANCNPYIPNGSNNTMGIMGIITLVILGIILFTGFGFVMGHMFGRQSLVDKLFKSPTYELHLAVERILEDERRYYYDVFVNRNLRVYYKDDLDTMEHKITILEKLSKKDISVRAVHEEATVGMTPKRGKKEVAEERHAEISRLLRFSDRTEEVQEK